VELTPALLTAGLSVAVGVRVQLDAPPIAVVADKGRFWVATSRTVRIAACSSQLHGLCNRRPTFSGFKQLETFIVVNGRLLVVDSEQLYYRDPTR
jgi:hypothetical protein